MKVIEMKEAKKIAYCGMMAALSIVIMVIGSIAGLGMYAGPLFAGLLLASIGSRIGRKYHVMMWLAVSALCFMLIANIEQNLMFLCLFGCYPILWPYFMRLKAGWRLAAKLIFFNVVVTALEVLIMLVLVPESMGTVLTIVLLLMGNFMFIIYDFLVPRADLLIMKLLGRIKGK